MTDREYFVGCTDDRRPATPAPEGAPTSAEIVAAVALECAA